jgi:threonine dehydratase
MQTPLENARAAQVNISKFALRTPLLRLNADSEHEVFLKVESLQPIGSFKIRGAANAMAHLNSGLGVLTASAGNMAQGVAYCARRMGIQATVVTPETAPETKLKAVERLGGRIIKVPFEEWWRTFEERSYPGVDATFIHAFDDDEVMAGNGVIGLELIEDLPDLETVVVPWGGGGLACGIAAVVKSLKPSVKVYAAECETGAPLTASMAAGKPVIVDYRPSFVDGIASKTVFPRMLDLARKWLDGTFVMTLDEAASAIRLAAERNRVILEGAAGCALAAAVSDRVQGKVVAIASGGNIDFGILREILDGRR